MFFKKKEKENNYLKFISQEIPISFEEVHHNIEDIANKKDSKFSDKLYFLYDKQSNRFIYIYDSNIYIFNHKGILEKSTKIDLIEKIKLAAVEYTCNYMLILTKSNQGIISDLNNNFNENYNSIFDKGDFLGGFFIKRNNNKNDRLCKLCMVSNKNFIISKIYTEQIEKGELTFKRKKFFTSKDMRIYNYYYSSDFKIIILRIELCYFLVVNLKSKICYENLINLNNLNTKEIIPVSLFLVRNIYHKLYFIHMNSKNIELYEIKDLKNIKPPKIINLDLGVNQQNVKLQFTNNLIFIFNEKNIYIYDIKSKIKNNIITINYMKNKEYQNFYKNIKIFGDYIEIGKKFYKTIFIPEKFYELNKTEENFKEKELFLILLRREKSRNIIKKILIDTILNGKVEKIYNLINILVTKYAKNKNIIQDKKNPFQVINLLEKNYFFLNSDEIFALFSRKINDINPKRIIQFMGILYNLYEKNNIPIDNDIFVSTLFYQINLVNNFPFLEIGFKNKLIPKNNKLGMYLIDKAIHTKNIITDWEKIFDLGIENLLLNEEGLGQAIDELFENNKYFDCFDLIIDFYTKINLQKNEDKGKMNYIKRMVSGQFNALNKNNNNENNIQQNDENIKENNDE
jgi:hypothetical protein